MGRLWLALAVIVALVAPALATAPHVPATPKIKTAYLEIGQQSTSTGLYEVTLLMLDAQLDRYAATVRITLRTAAGEQFTVETTPDRLGLVHPNLFAPVGTSHLSVTSIGTNRLESAPAEIDVVAQPEKTTSPDSPLALLLVLLLVVGGCIGVLVMLGVLFKMRATEAERARVRRDTEPTPLAGPAAEEHIRTVALRALFALVVVTAVVVVPIGAGVPMLPIVAAPLFLVLAVGATTRLINAGRAIALLHRPHAAARTRYDQLEVALGAREVTLRSSPKLVERARRDALPKARV